MLKTRVFVVPGGGDRKRRGREDEEWLKGWCCQEEGDVKTRGREDEEGDEEEVLPGGGGGKRKQKENEEKMEDDFRRMEREK